MHLAQRVDRDLYRHLGDPPPSCWGPPPNASGRRLGSTLTGIRRLDRTSDELVAWLVGGPARKDVLGLSLLVAALAPLAIRRCSGRPELIDDLLADIVLVAGTIQVDGLSRSRRRHASLILDRAWDLLRREARRPVKVLPADPAGLEERSIVDEFDESVADRTVLFELRSSLIRGDNVSRTAIRAWNSALVLSERASRTDSERSRLNYSLRVLRRHCAAGGAA